MAGWVALTYLVRYVCRNPHYTWEVSHLLTESPFVSSGIGVSIEELIERDGTDINRDMAKQLLATCNKDNRHIKPRKLAAYTRDMANDRWLKDGAPLRFGRDGRLYDGQHRLAALINASILREERGLSGADWSIRFLIFSDLDEEARLVIDTGAPKTVRDAALINEGVTYAQHVVAIGNRIYNWVNAKNPVPNTRTRVTPTALEFAAFYRNFAAEVNQAAYWGGHLLHRVKCPAVAGGLAHFLIYEAQDDFHEETGIDAAAEFFAGFSTGEMLVKGHPVKTLRETITARRDRHELNTDIALALTLRAWNAFAEERMIGSLQLPPNRTVTNATLDMARAPRSGWTGDVYKPNRA